MIVKKLVAALAAAAFLVTAAAPPAFAGTRFRHSGYNADGGHYYQHRPYRRQGRIGRHGQGNAAVVLGALAGAVVLGALLSQPRPVSARPAFARPAPAGAAFAHPAVLRSPSGAALGDCVQTIGTGTWNGRPARFAGTLCTDPAGRAYVVNDSVRFLMYLN